MSEDDHQSIPTRLIHDRYQQSLAARNDYQQALGGPFESAAHEQLHDAVANYFEVLRPLLSSSNACDDLWEEAELWPVQPKFIDAIACPNCQAYVPLDAEERTLQSGDRCQNCGGGPLERSQVPSLDENGQIEYEYVTGLQSLDNAFDHVQEREQTVTDALGEHTTQTRQTDLLPAQHLKLVSRKLDEALRKLDLHAPVEDQLSKGKVSKEGLP